MPPRAAAPGLSTTSADARYQPLDSDLTTWAAVNPATWVGSTSITTLGTITTGVWSGTVIAPSKLGTGTPSASTVLYGDGTWGAPSGGGAYTATSSASPTLTSADITVDLSSAVPVVTLPSAATCSAGYVLRLRNASGGLQALKLVRASSDTLDGGATAAFGLLAPGDVVEVRHASSSTWTTTMPADSHRAMQGGGWWWKASAATAGDMAGGPASAALAGTMSNTVTNGVVVSTASTTGATSAHGWTHGSKYSWSDGSFVMDARLAISSVTNTRLLVGIVDGWYSGTRGGWGGKGYAIQAESGDTNWQIISRNGTTLRTADSGAPWAVGWHRLLLWKRGSSLYWAIWSSATDPTFAGVTPVTGTTTPADLPATTALQWEVYSAAASSSTWTTSLSWFGLGEGL